MPDLQTKQTYSLLTLILVAAGTAAAVVYASNNIRAARQLIG
jgi:hypothetical protein